MSFLYYFVLVIFLINAALLSFVVLIQESKSMGLGASFGGDHASSLFGTSTADVLKKFTAYVAIVFVMLSIVLSSWSSKGSRSFEPVPTLMEEVVGK